MRFRTPVSSAKKHNQRYWKTSPRPSASKEGTIPLQQIRSANIQQARDHVALELFEFEPSPEQLPRYNDDADQESPSFKVGVKPKYPMQHLKSDTMCYEIIQNRGGVYPNRVRTAIAHRPLTTFGLFTFMVLAVASLHLINFGNHTFEGLLLSSSGKSGKNIFLSDKTFFVRSGHHRELSRVGHPRTFIMADLTDASGSAPPFQPPPGRKVELYRTEHSDVTQLYDQKSSDDEAIAGTMERKFFPMHETNPDCVPMAEWQTKSFPTCNTLHEMGLLSDGSMRLLSSTGSWRDAWRFKAYVALPKNWKQILDNVVVKTIKFQHSLQERYLEFSRVDALAMERLTSNPYIMGIHAFCGVSVVTMRGEDDVAHFVDHVKSRDKVDMARKVARSIAAVHEIDGPDHPVSLVHNDVNANNIFTGRKNVPLLNDFNIAVLMMKDRNTNETCPFPGHFPNQQWKSPEEQVGPDGNAIGKLNEKVDIYALGNVLFRFATGKAPWREVFSSKHAKLTSEQKNYIARLKVEEGTMPAVPEHILKLKNPYIDLLLEAMKLCFRWKPEDRPTAREVADFLERGKEELDENLVDFGRFPKSGK